MPDKTPILPQPIDFPFSDLYLTAFLLPLTILVGIETFRSHLSTNKGNKININVNIVYYDILNIYCCDGSNGCNIWHRIMRLYVLIK